MASTELAPTNARGIPEELRTVFARSDLRVLGVQAKERRELDEFAKMAFADALVNADHYLRDDPLLTAMNTAADSVQNGDHRNDKGVPVGDVVRTRIGKSGQVTIPGDVFDKTVKSLARHVHPDITSDSDATEAFKGITATRHHGSAQAQKELH